MSTIAVVKVSIGYLSAGNRSACLNCKHATSGTDHPPRYTCTRYGFTTTAMAICRDHAIKPTTQQGSPA